MNKKIYSVNEMFLSVEGEGIRTGLLSTFVRFNGCNLCCSYCDTLYAQDVQEPNMSLQEILESIAKLVVDRVTLTGGEPLFRAGMERSY